MATTLKTTLKKALDQTDYIDPAGLSPFVGLHLGGLDHIHVYRTSAVGFIETEGAPDIKDPGWAFVSHGHLKDCLRCLDSEQVEVLILTSGNVLIRSVNAVFETELRVHTVDRRSSGIKAHTPGPTFIPLEPEWLGGFDIRPFTLVAQPAVAGDRLLLMTASGTVTWTTTYNPEVPSSPRESFLKAISGMTKGTLELTESGFYRAVVDGMHICSAGHRSPCPTADIALTATALDGVDLPGGRLVHALRQAVTMAGQGMPIQINPKSGVTTKDIYANVARFSLGDTSPFPNLVITIGTAKVLVEALGQSNLDFATISQPEGRTEWFRITRGNCEVSFRIVA